MAECASLLSLLSLLLSGNLSEVMPEPLGTLPMSCLKMHISHILGYAIVAGSAMVKVPQLLKIFRAKNAEGISLSSMNLEMCASLSSFCYYMALGYPFSTWGENFFIFFQNVALSIMVFHYSIGLGNPKAIGMAIFCVLLGIVLYGRLLPDIDLPPLLCSSLGLSRCILTCEDVAGGLPSMLMLVGRLPQIMQNFKQQHTGQLAFITYFLNVAGGAARVFTTLQQLNDPITLFTIVSGLIQNAVILLQIVLLGSAPVTEAGRKKE